MFWYDAAVNGELISTGSEYTTPTLTNSTNYYVESVKGKGSKVGPVDNTIGSGNTNNSGYLKFDTRLALKIISVKVVANTPGNRTIELRNSSVATYSEILVALFILMIFPEQLRSTDPVPQTPTYIITSTTGIFLFHMKIVAVTV